MSLDPKEYDQFIALAMIKLPGASTNGVKANLYDVMKEFFADSNSWREDIQFQADVAKDEYLLAPSEGQIIRLIGTWDDKGIPVPSFMPTFGTLKLLHAPESKPPTKWFSRVIKTVTAPVTNQGLPIAPQWALGVYSVHILDGLLGKMMGEQDKTYTNSAMGVYHLRRFRQGIKIAEAEVNAANVVGAQAWAFPRFGGGSQRGGVSTAWPTRAF